jgi:hypothetical protein
MRLDVAGTTRFNLRQLQVQGRADGETLSFYFLGVFISTLVFIFSIDFQSINRLTRGPRSFMELVFFPFGPVTFIFLYLKGMGGWGVGGGVHFFEWTVLRSIRSGSGPMTLTPAQVDGVLGYLNRNNKVATPNGISCHHGTSTRFQAFKYGI